MRYAEGTIPKEQLAMHASDNMLILTSFIAFIIAIVLIRLGLKGKQMYMWTWGIGLALFSVYLGISIWLDWKPFTYF
jgi:flagellar biosynthesis protein FliP